MAIYPANHWDIATEQRFPYEDEFGNKKECILGPIEYSEGGQKRSREVRFDYLTYKHTPIGEPK